MQKYFEWAPARVNEGPFVTSYTLDELRERMMDQPAVLPICSLGTSVSELAEVGTLVLPPLFHEGLDSRLQLALLERIQACFPYFAGTRRREELGGELRIVELPRRKPPAESRPRVLALSIDTAVEQHGPHLPLATDRIQSYGLLTRLAQEIDGLVLGPPLDYGQLTWGLPFGMSIDITAPLLTQYVTRCTNALVDWLAPEAIYVVDVHGSAVHRGAIQEGLAASRCSRWAFRWLYDPIHDYAGGRGDQHAGGVETALIHYINPPLVDAHWWPERVAELAAGQLALSEVVELQQDMKKFIQHVESTAANGIVGDVHNFFRVDGATLFNAMLDVARRDVAELLA